MAAPDRSVRPRVKIRFTPCKCWGRSDLFTTDDASSTFSTAVIFLDALSGTGLLFGLFILRTVAIVADLFWVALSVFVASVFKFGCLDSSLV
jgi:hypothetical protein